MAKNWAIAVGINRYSNLKALKYAKRDAEAMRDWFEQKAGFDRVFLFTEDSPSIVSNPPIATQPTFGHLFRFLRAQFENTRKPLLGDGDNLWFFFAGHGKRSDDKDYLMLSDSDPEEPERTALSVEWITERLRRSGADNVVLLLDACRDGDKRGRLGIGTEDHQGVITYYSCSETQASWEIEELQQGAFTAALLEGLERQGEANCATVERLNQYLCYRVPEISELYKKPEQNPCLKAEPPYKMYYVLLNKYATLKDAEPLKLEAALAEAEKKWELAEQLWIRVWAVSPGDMVAIRAIQRLARRQPAQAKPLNQVITEQSGSRSKGQKTASTSSSPKQVSLFHSIIANNSLTRRRLLQMTGLGGLGIGIVWMLGNLLRLRSSLNELVKSPDEESSINLTSFNFGNVTVDATGTIIKREQQTAQSYGQDLGNGVILEMVAIPGGEFTMGSPADEVGRYESESPQRGVSVEAFFLAKNPITQAQWRVVANLPQIGRELNPNPSRFKGDSLPVELVFWYDAVEFCARLSQYTGRNYVLPSEAQWEYACRAETKTPFHFGATITSELANYDATETYAQESPGEYRGKTTPIDNFDYPNKYGLYDMHGNVWEWCADPWHENYEGAPTKGKVWDEQIEDDNHYQNYLESLSQLLKDERERVLRGGSWGSDPRNCRSAYRFRLDPDHRGSFIGFRVARFPPRT